MKKLRHIFFLFVIVALSYAWKRFSPDWVERAFDGANVSAEVWGYRMLYLLFAGLLCGGIFYDMRERSKLISGIVCLLISVAVYILAIKENPFVLVYLMDKYHYEPPLTFLGGILLIDGLRKMKEKNQK